MSLLDLAFGKTLKKHRDYNKLTQDKLAKMLGISRASVVYYEHGKQSPSLEVAIKASKVLNFDIHEVLETLESLDKSSGLNMVAESQRDAMKQKLNAIFAQKKGK